MSRELQMIEDQWRHMDRWSILLQFK